MYQWRWLLMMVSDMMLFSICLLVLFGVSLLSFAEPRRKPTSVQSKYALPPNDWPDVPVDDLSLFQQTGRINAPMPDKPRRGLRRFRSFEDTQAFVLGLVDTRQGRVPMIGLQLSSESGPDWTEVICDGQVVAHVCTAALTQGTSPAVARLP